MPWERHLTCSHSKAPAHWRGGTTLFVRALKKAIYHFQKGTVRMIQSCCRVLQDGLPLNDLLLQILQLLQITGGRTDHAVRLSIAPFRPRGEGKPQCLEAQ